MWYEFAGGMLVGMLIMLATCGPYILRLQRRYDWAMDFIKRQQAGIAERAIRREQLDDAIRRLHHKQ